MPMDKLFSKLNQSIKDFSYSSPPISKRILSTPNPSQRSFWMQDNQCTQCYSCSSPFHTFRRKHHCRICGQIFCSKCSQYVLEEEKGKKLRVCGYCHRMVQNEEAIGGETECSKEKRNNVEMSSEDNTDTWASVRNNQLTFSTQESGKDHLYLFRKVNGTEHKRRRSFHGIPRSVSEHRHRRTSVKQHKRSYSIEMNVKQRELGEEMSELSASRIDFIQKMVKVMTEGMAGNWEDILHKLLLKVLNNVNIPIVSMADNDEHDNDIRNYIHVKKVLGLSPAASYFIKGIVISKNVAHKKMMREISQPRILLITFALEYSRVNQLMSLDPLIAQERHHLKHLVNRILANKPDIVLCSNNVSRLALEYLMEAGVVVVTNVKMSVIDALERMTEAEKVSNIAMLNDCKVGSCGSFNLHSYTLENDKKSLMFFDRCLSDLGATLVLRCSDMSVLQQVKKLTRFLLFAAYNLKLEMHLAFDLFISVKSEGDGDFTAKSMSPFIDYGKQLDLKQDMEMLNFINVLCSMTNGITENVCCKQELNTIVHYNEGDFNLFQFIEFMYTESNKTCPECHTKMCQHIKHYVHNNVKVSIACWISPSTKHINDEHVYSHFLCRECSVKSHLVALSEESLKFSLGKFLEFYFYGNANLTNRMFNQCQHKVFNDYERNFVYKNMTLTFTSEYVKLFEVAVPKPILSYNFKLDYVAMNRQKKEKYFKEKINFDKKEDFFPLLSDSPANGNLADLIPEDAESFSRGNEESAGHDYIESSISELEISVCIPSADQILSSPLDDVTDDAEKSKSKLSTESTAPNYDYLDDIYANATIPSHVRVRSDTDFSKRPGSDRSSVFMRTLNNFLSKEYLANKTNFYEHFFSFSDVIVNENNPSSIVALVLNSCAYMKMLLETERDVGNPLKIFDESDEYEISAESEATQLEDSFQALATSTSENNNSTSDIEATLSRSTAHHLKFTFTSNDTIFSVTVFFPSHFNALRTHCQVTHYFINSLSHSTAWESTGGKSGSSFFKTFDNRFILKQISKAEMDSFLQLATSYFHYLSRNFFHALPSILSKLFGVYRITVKNALLNTSAKIDILVMENVFYEYLLEGMQVFDVKGTDQSRVASESDSVLLDANLPPVYLTPSSHSLLTASLWNDTLFLSKHNVMDYSLLLAMDKRNSILVVGLIDWLRTFTWDKRVESWVKEGVMWREPTVRSPKMYKDRFRGFVGRCFLGVGGLE